MVTRLPSTGQRAMEASGFPARRAYTLVEVVLVVGLLVVVAGLAIPTFVQEIRREELPASADQLRSLISLMRAHAALDGKRYRLRFPMQDQEERDAMGDDRQPIIEREQDPIDDPDVFYPAHTPWAIGNTLLGKVWCAEVRLGKPTVEKLRFRRSEIRDKLEEAFDDFEPERLPFEMEIDGTSDWATFVLTEAPRDADIEDLEDYPTLEVILDGETGLVYIQRPLYDEELDLFEEKGWPCVLGQDYTSDEEITEERVLEIHEFRIGT
jgi:type II secretory pathway pseudopilin PulG